MATLSYPTFAGGQRLTAALLQAMQTTYYDIAADVPNATTTLADTGLTFSPVINSTWLLQLRAAYACSAANVGMNLAWSAPTGASVTRNILSAHYDTTDNQNATMNVLRRGTTTQQSGGSFSGAFTGWWEDCYLTMGSTSGAVKVQFAAKNAGTATFRASSYFTALRIA